MNAPTFLLGLQAAMAVLSMLGYGIFTARPDLLAVVDPGARFYLWAFSGFAIANVVLGGLAVVGEAVQENGKAIIAPFLAIYTISLLSELGGTTYGIPFGAYSYTELLGVKWFDKVPLIIPLSWFTMAWPAWVIARSRHAGLIAVLVGSALLVAWDLVLDPAMSGATSYWVWTETGSYYGMPWRNLLGWAITGLVLLTVLAKLTPSPRADVSFAVKAYAVNVSLPIGLSILNGYWIAAAAGALSALAALGVAIGTKRLSFRNESLASLGGKS